jgi:excisionase family DNA binding protein
MSSNIKINRVCQLCGKDFIARTTSTQYCGSVCSKKAYKERKRAERIEASNTETANQKSGIEAIKKKEFLTVRDASILLDCSRRTIYYLIENGTLKSKNISQRLTRIDRAEIDKLFKKKKLLSPPQKAPVAKFKYKVEECYTVGEVQKKFNISDSALTDIIKRNGIPKLKRGWYVYVPKKEIDKLLK